MGLLCSGWLESSVLASRIWLPVDKSGYRPVTGFPEPPREIV
jgi:hypothetical protein